MVPGSTSVLRICNESPQPLAQKVSSLSEISDLKTLTNVSALHQNTTDAVMWDTRVTSERGSLTETSEFSLSKELVELLPENFRPKSSHELRWHSTQPFKIFTNDSLPPYETTLIAIEGLFHIQSASLHLYFIDEKEAREILKAVYSGNASLLMLCELFAAAAVGSQWEERVSSEVVHGYFNTVKAHLDDCLEEDDLRGMRLLGLCSMFLLSEKRISSWSYIGSALQIGHSRGLQYSQQPDNILYDNWIGLRRLWRTLIFFESWVAASLGRIPVYSLECGSVDLSELEQSLDSQGPSKCNAIQLELVKIGILNAQILKNVFVPPTVSLPVVREFMLKLEDWFDNLPDSMRLASMLSSYVSPGERTTVFTIHIMYLSTIILLTRRVMIEIFSGKGNCLGEPLKDSMPYVNACVSAAKQTAGILALLYAEYGGGLFKKCWLAICSSFNASVILLFFAAQKKLLGQPRKSYQNDLIDASKCLAVIEASAKKDELARCYLKLLAPFREAVGEGDADCRSPNRALSSSSVQHFDPKPSDLSPLFHGPDKFGIVGIPLSPEDPEITNGLLDIIRKPYVYDRDDSNDSTPPSNCTYYTTSSGGPHQEAWTLGDCSCLGLSPKMFDTPGPNLSPKTINTPSLSKANMSPSKKRGRDVDLVRDNGWEYNKRLRYSPKSLEAFLRRVA